MKSLLSLTMLAVFSAANVFAQDLPKRATENPLNCVFYLLSKNDSLDKFDAEPLAMAFQRVGRIEDAVRTVELLKDDEDKFELLLNLAKKFAAEKQTEKANEILLKSFIAAKKNERIYTEKLSELTAQLVAAGFYREAAEVIENTADTEYKLEILIALSNQLLRIGQNERALELLPDVLQNARISSSADYNVWGTAQAGLIYAKLQQREKALELLNESRQLVFSIEEPDKSDDKILQTLIEGFVVAGQPETAIEIWQTHGDSENEYKARQFVKTLSANGYEKDANEILAQFPAEPSVRLFLSRGETEKALEFAKAMSEDEDNSFQQSALREIADKYLEIGKTEAALAVIDFAFRRALKVDTSEPELPQHSFGATSGSRKVGYLREISESYVKANRFDRALLAVNAIHKPIIQAIALTDLAEKQIKFASQNKVLAHLSRALVIVRMAKDVPLDFEKETALTRIAEVYAKADAKEKAVAVFAEVLEIMVEDYNDDYMLEIGIAFEEAKIKSDARIKKALRQIIESES